MSLSPVSSMEHVGPIGGLGEFEHQTLVKLRVEGLLDRTYGAESYWGSAAGQPAGQVDAKGYFSYNVGNCLANVSVSFVRPNGLGGGGYTFCSVDNSRAMQSVYEVDLVVQGSGSARWTKGPASWTSYCDVAGRDPCYYYSGDFTVSVQRYEAALTLSASTTQPASGQAVTFTASISSVEGKTVPYSAVRWTWEDNRGSNTVCSTSLNCTYTPPRPGSMHVSAIVNGEEDSAYVDIMLSSCIASGDSVLNDWRVRKGLESAFDMAKSINREMPIIIYRDLFGQHFVSGFPNAPSTECTTTLLSVDSLRADGFDVVASAHPHLEPPNTFYSCSASTTPVLSPPGAGHQDWPSVNSLNQSTQTGAVPHYIVRPDDILRMYPGGTAGSELALRIPRTATCGWRSTP